MAFRAALALLISAPAVLARPVSTVKLTAGGLNGTIVASPAVATTSPAEFTVTWSGVPGAETSTDWISVYCAGAAEPAFGAWQYTSVDPGYKSGSGTMSFKLEPMACAAEFRLYRNEQTGGPYDYMATSNSVTWNGNFTSSPRHVRVAYGTKPQTEATVSWTSDDGANKAILYVGTQPGRYDTVASADLPITYTNDDMCAPSGSYRFPGYFHHTLLAGLKAGTRYHVLPSQNGVNGTETSFVTGKPVGAFVPSRFAMFGDMLMSGGLGGAATVAHLKAQAGSLDYVLHVGDISYGEGNVGTWNAWHAVASDITSTLPYMVSIGNHEYDYSKSQDGSKDPSGVSEMYSPSWWNGGGDSGGECGVPSVRRFRVPSNGNGPFWYSFEAANVHVTMVSSEHDPNPGSPMGDWLEEDLLGVDRGLTPWLILGIHRPLVETEQYAGDYAVANGLRAILEPLLLRAKVDAVLSGHYHSFQRSCSMANLKCVTPGSGEHGIVHITSGAAGQGLDNVALYPSDYIDNTILGKYGYSIIEAPNSTALGLLFYENTADASNPVLVDTYWILRDA